MFHKQKRTALVKGYLTDDHKEALQGISRATKKSISDLINEGAIFLIRSNVASEARRNSTAPIVIRDRPKPRENKAHFPSGRTNFGVVPVVRYRV